MSAPEKPASSSGDDRNADHPALRTTPELRRPVLFNPRRSPSSAPQSLAVLRHCVFPSGKITKSANAQANELDNDHALNHVGMSRR